jgi:hypothetical protein
VVSGVVFFEIQGDGIHDNSDRLGSLVEFAAHTLFEELFVRTVLFADDVDDEEVVFVQLAKAGYQSVHVLLGVGALVEGNVGQEVGGVRDLTDYGRRRGRPPEPFHPLDDSFEEALFFRLQHLVEHQFKGGQFADQSSVGLWLLIRENFKIAVLLPDNDDLGGLLEGGGKSLEAV